jgi:hypothetical protein
MNGNDPHKCLPHQISLPPGGPPRSAFRPDEDRLTNRGTVLKEILGVPDEIPHDLFCRAQLCFVWRSDLNRSPRDRKSETSGRPDPHVGYKTRSRRDCGKNGGQDLSGPFPTEFRWRLRPHHTGAALVPMKIIATQIAVSGTTRRAAQSIR